MPSSGLRLLRDYVERHNAGVRTGDFGPMLEYFADDAELVFEGAPIGPFRGREAIRAAYRDRPPDDTVEILDAREDDRVVAAGYGWSREPGVRAGEIRLTLDDGRVAKLVVTFDAAGARR